MLRNYQMYEIKVSFYAREREEDSVGELTGYSSPKPQKPITKTIVAQNEEQAQLYMRQKFGPDGQGWRTDYQVLFVAVHEAPVLLLEVPY